MSNEKRPAPGSDAIYREMAARVMVEVARDLRHRQTTAEDVLWQALRGRRLGNLKFRRQHPVAGTSFVADFLCYDARLVIEIDGSVHTTQQQEDIWRQQAIEDAGYKVLRFTNEQVLENLPSVLAEIHRTALAASPLPEGEGSGVRADRQSD